MPRNTDSLATLAARSGHDQLRRQHYNATIDQVIEVHDELRILRIVPDDGVPSYEPGQYTVLGLGNWEPTVPHIPKDKLDPPQLHKITRRAYSMACSMVDVDGRLMTVADTPYLEFYLVLVRETADRTPVLTPRLFMLESKDRLLLGTKITGHYTLERVRPEDDCIFIATGTGEAPHNAMVAQLLRDGHRGRIISLTCVRKYQDLGYVAAHHQLEFQYPNYRYQILTTREPENVNSELPTYVGKRHLQDYVNSGDFERDADIAIDPVGTHVFLCGNPDMIGAPKRGPDGRHIYPQPKGLVEVLEERGFRVDEPRRPGNIHFEKYW